MIISVFNKGNDQPEKYSFTDALVFLGRSPPAQASVTINSHTISRNHLKVKVAEGNIQIMDLNSSNGTFLEGEKIEPNSWTNIKPADKVQVAEFQGYVTFTVREASISRPLAHNKVNKAATKSQSSDSEQRSRSREKQPKRKELPFKISESTLKMVKDMTINRKSKEERVKFLKLMGIGKAEEYWSEIEQLLKQKKGIKDSKKTHDELERQFSSARSGIQKRGLGK